MEYKGVTIRAEVTSYDIWTLDDNGYLKDWHTEGCGVDITGYTFEGNGVAEFVGMSETTGEQLKEMADDFLKRRVLIGQDEQGYYTDSGYITDKEISK